MKTIAAAILLFLSMSVGVTKADSMLTPLVNQTWGQRTETLQAHADERAAFQVARSGGVCGPGALSHDGWQLSEVLACSYVGPSDAVQSWLNSPPHNAVLSDLSHTEIGCASAPGVNGAWFYVCVLSGNGAPLPIAPVMVAPVPEVVLPNTSLTAP